MATDDIGAALRRAYQALAPETAVRRAAPLEDARAEWEERAAVREYDGGMSREEAERLTAVELGAQP